MKKFCWFALLICAVSFAGCSPLESTAYQTVVSANAFTHRMKDLHPECATGATTSLCGFLSKATSAKDALIDATEIYCAGPDFNAGGKCNPPAKGTDARTQAEAKLRAAISLYEQAETDLKGAIGKTP